MTQGSLTWTTTETLTLAARGNANNNLFKNFPGSFFCKWEHILFGLTLRFTNIYNVQTSTHTQTHTHMHLLLQILLLKTLVLYTPATGLTQYKLVHYTVTLSHTLPVGWWPLDHYATSRQGWQVWQLMCECVHVCVCIKLCGGPPSWYLLVLDSWGTRQDLYLALPANYHTSKGFAEYVQSTLDCLQNLTTC